MYKNAIIFLSIPFMVIGFLARFIWDGLVMGWMMSEYFWEVTK